jgi:hypothetical protein
VGETGLDLTKGQRTLGNQINDAYGLKLGFVMGVISYVEFAAIKT